MNDYLNLKIGAARRLGFLRNAAKRRNEKFPAGNATWKTVRYATFKSNTGLSEGTCSGETVWYAHEGAQFPREEYADECYRGIKHKGWFTDGSYDETARGVVVRLPHGKFLAGYEWSANDERAYFPEIFTDEWEAARAADGRAEYFAEMCREDDARRHEAQRLEGEAQELAHELAKELALRNNPRFPDARDHAREVIEELRAARERLQNEFAGYI